MIGMVHHSLRCALVVQVVGCCRSWGYISFEVRRIQVPHGMDVIEVNRTENLFFGG